MENYYTVSQKSDCGRLQEVLGLGFTRGPKGFLCKYLYYYYYYYYLFIYLFILFHFFNSGPVPRA